MAIFALQSNRLLYESGNTVVLCCALRTYYFITVHVHVSIISGCCCWCNNYMHRVRQIMILANNIPRLIDVSTGMLRRIHALVFPRRFYSPEEIAAMPEGERKEYANHDLA